MHNKWSQNEKHTIHAMVCAMDGHIVAVLFEAHQIFILQW